MICLLGFGEVGQTLAEDLRIGFTAWDLKFSDPNSAPARALAAQGLARPDSAAAAVTGADIVISAVTAAQDEEAARGIMAWLREGAYFMDLNSASPGAKQQTAALVEATGGRYVEAVVMSPIGKKRIASPMLLGGPRAAAFLPLAHRLGFSGAAVFSPEIGPASATKMCRSVIIKGIEALITESMLAAQHYGVAEEVLNSLSDFFPGHDWPTLAQYLISRGLLHGTRRAEEMREAARTVRETGIAPLMSEACAQRQDWAAQYSSALKYATLADMLDGIRRAAIPGIKDHKTC